MEGGGARFSQRLAVVEEQALDTVCINYKCLVHIWQKLKVEALP